MSPWAGRTSLVSAPSPLGRSSGSSRSCRSTPGPFGYPLRMSYSHAVKELGATGHDVLGANDQGLYGITRPDIGALIDLLVSHRGLFVLTPITALAVRESSGPRTTWASVGSPPRGRAHGCDAVVQRVVLLPIRRVVSGSAVLGALLLLPFLAFPLADAWLRWRKVTLVVAGISAFWMISATVAGRLLPDYERPSLWLRRIVNGDDLAGSILVDGRSGAAVFLALALAAVLLAAGAVDFAVRRWRTSEA